ncbi:anaphase-promoting complex subunit 13-like [Halichondria panicea]|uniref:anaphase-promoting complex subunit 13-like n=1 Tax=Halichondria panicea TaxID=6063 RepID=UPI00312B8CAB
MDSKLSYAHRDSRLLDERVVDKAWRKDRLPVVDIEVPTYELPLPEGVGEEKLHQDNLSVRQIEETWRERLLEMTSGSG